MARINLLPWRQERREEQKVEFFVFTGLTAVVAILLVGAAWMLLNTKLSNQQEANQVVKTAMDGLNGQLTSLDGLDDKRKAIIERIKLIQDLQGKRPIIVHIFDELARTVPSNMYLTEIKRGNDKVEVKGFAESPNVVSEFMRKLDDSEWFQSSFMNSYNAPVAVQVTEVAPPADAQAPQALVTTAASNAASPFTAPKYGRPEDKYGAFAITVHLQDKNNWTEEKETSLKSVAESVLNSLPNLTNEAQAQKGGVK